MDNNNNKAEVASGRCAMLVEGAASFFFSTKIAILGKKNEALRFKDRGAFHSKKDLAKCNEKTTDGGTTTEEAPRETKRCS